MKIGGLQKVSLRDYPGKISAIVFTRGCNFRCPYCHNPELVDPGLYQKCLPEEEFFSYLEIRKGKLEAVTITGGEPTIQNDLIPFIMRVKAMGRLIKIDTNGSKPEVLKELIRRNLVDYLAMDIKAPLEKYAAIARTPVNGIAIRQSIMLIMNSGIDYEFRTTVVKSQIKEADLLAIGRLIKNASLYSLQRYVPAKPLDKNFLTETTLSQGEFGNVKKILEKNIRKVIIR
ncbi:MAG TPA: anaerobic ribonucleoside-triphosphate reductase activating protein [Syntrophales bacterium]|nr:anaerobic ribonucleoside-triphosphate reductase activating protein [Syntrophales bacterium]